MWKKNFGGNNKDHFLSITRIMSGEYIVVGDYLSPDIPELPRIGAQCGLTVAFAKSS